MAKWEWEEPEHLLEKSLTPAQWEIIIKALTLYEDWVHTETVTNLSAVQLVRSKAVYRKKKIAQGVVLG